jgi:hypothetical protein
VKLGKGTTQKKFLDVYFGMGQKNMLSDSPDPLTYKQKVAIYENRKEKLERSPKRNLRPQVPS